VKNTEKRGRMLGAEFRRLSRSRMAMLSVVGLLVIPLLYSGMLIGAFWDPYAKLSELPVAVVNEDKGAVMDGKSVQVGSDLTEELKKQKDFKWAFTSGQEAMNGLKEHRYAMAFIIPGNFSQQTTTLKNETPQLAEIQYFVDDGWNYLNSRIGSEASEQLKTKVSHEVTKAYADAVLGSVGDAADGLKEASDGAAKLADGAQEAQTGAQTLHDNLSKLADGSLELKQGLNKIKAGSARLVEGTGTVSAGSVKLADSLNQVSAAGGQLSAGAAHADEGASRLAAGASKLQQSGTALAAGASELDSGSKGVASAADQLSQGLKKYAAEHADASGDAAFQELVKSAQQLAAGAGKVQQGAHGLSDGASQMASAEEALAQGSAELQTGTAQLHEKLDLFAGKLKEIESGAVKLSDGAQTLASGAQSLHKGIASAGQGMLKVNDGTVRLAGGSLDLASGIHKLTDGSIELSGKLGEASQDAKDMPTGKKQTDQFAEPVSMSEHKLAGIPNYGTGMTPYFLSLGLYVGILMSTVILPLRDAAGRVDSGWKWYLSKLLLFAPVVVLQTVLVDSVLLFGFGLHVSNVPLFYGVSLAIALTFMTILQFFITLADQIGRFIGVVLLTLQLAASAGTYPSELLPVWLQAIGPWMPMTHAIAALRLVVAGGAAAEIGSQLLALAVYALMFIIFTLVLFVVKYQRQRHLYGGLNSEAAVV
jgi:putative membrane protein